LIQSRFYGFFIKETPVHDLLAFEGFSPYFVNIPIQKTWTFYNFLNIHNTYSFVFSGKMGGNLPYTYIK